MSDFPTYRSTVTHVPAEVDQVASARLSLLGGVVDRLEKLADAEDASEQKLNRIRYQNMALEESVRAYREHPADIDGYRKAYRSAMGGHDIPLVQRADYEAILLNGEARFISPILLNRAGEDAARRREQMLALADNLYKDGTFVLGGEVGPSDPADGNYAGDRYLESVGVLGAVMQDDGSMLPPADIYEKLDTYELGALSAHAGRRIAGEEDPSAAMEQYIAGEEYAVEVSSSSGAIRLSSKDLSDHGREQLRSNIRSAVENNLEDRASMAHFIAGRELVRLPAAWRGTAHQRKAVDTWARMQMDAQPLSADNEGMHIDNMIMFARKFSYIPEVYVDLLTTNINGGSGEVSVSASNLLAIAIESGGARISKQFDDVTLLRGTMLHDMVWHGAMAPKQALDAVNSIFNNPRSRDYAISLNKKLRDNISGRDRANIYGNDVAAEEYGHDGVALYESLVRDYYIMNGGDSKSARTVARARIDAVYSYPKYGAYRRDGWIFKSGGRKLRYQPGAYYGEWADEHIDGDMRDNVLPAARELGYDDITVKNYFLVANLLTVDAFNGGDRAPVWEVWYKRADGSSVQVTDKGGNIVAYRVGDMAADRAGKNVNNAALRRQANLHNWAVEQLREGMKRPDNERLFLRMLESAGEGF